MVKRNGVWKIFTIIGILLLAVLLCYFSVALYFYFGKVNDISGKLKVYNLMSDESVGEMYLDASYCLQSGDKKFYGINVDESGYLVTIASDVADETDFYAYSGRGEVFFGKLVFCDESYNLAIVKLFDIVDSEKELSLPYVSIGDISYSTFSLNPSYIVVGNPLENNNILSINSLSLYKYIIYTTSQVDGSDVVDYVNVNAYYYTISDHSKYSQEAVFNRTGELLGLVYSYSDNAKNDEMFILSVSIIKTVLDDVKNSEYYENSLVSKVNGFDMYELQCYLDCSNTNSGVYYIYFDGLWREVDTNLITKYQNGLDGVYLVEDFVYGDEIIKGNSLITSVNYKQKSYSITTKLDLFYLFYQAKSGEEIKITWQDLDTTTISTTSLVVL